MSDPAFGASPTAWAVPVPARAPARGEEIVGTLLDGLAASGIRVLHDRRVPGWHVSISHIAVTKGGVWVIDSESYAGKRPSLRAVGGFIRPRTESLLVDSRNESRVIDGVRQQVGLITAALRTSGTAEIPVRGMLCIVDADWPILGGHFSVSGVQVAWPAKVGELLAMSGAIDDLTIKRAHRMLAAAFPTA